MIRNGKRVANRSGAFSVWNLDASRVLIVHQILRADFLSRQKQWELEQARSAPEAPQAPEDEEMPEISDAIDGN